MASATMRSALVRLAPCACALALACLGPAGARHRGDQRLALTAARGTLQLVDSRSGVAVLSAGNLEPGRSTTGTVALSNEGTTAGRLSLSSAAPFDSPGPGGEALADRLELRIDEIHAPRSLVASGTVSRLAGCHRLGVLPAGATRTYRFTASLPDGGTRDNALQGSATSVNETWTLSSAGCGEPPAIADERRPAPRIRVDHTGGCHRGRLRITVLVGGSSLRRVEVLVDGRLLLVTRRRRFTLRPLLARPQNRLVVRAWGGDGAQSALHARLRRCA